VRSMIRAPLRSGPVHARGFAPQAAPQLLVQRQALSDAFEAGPAPGSCACGGGCPRCEAATAVQPKLAVSVPTDPLELEADRVAEEETRNDSITAAPSITPATPGPLQRACACGGNSEADCACEESDDIPAQRKTSNAPQAPPALDPVSLGPGEPMPQSLRAHLEPRFGRSFADVRLHHDDAAAASARGLNSLAYTVGRDIVFASGQYRPDAVAGRRLLAHELTHVVQQSQGGLALQRFVPCTHARMSLEECPRREPNEVEESRNSPMIVEYIEWPEKGYLIADFGIGQSRLKPSAKTHKNWSPLVQAVSDPTTEWSIIGLSDCHGDDSLNTSLRKERADAVFGALPLPAASRIVNSSGARLFNCITDNTTSADRAFNRSVLITREKQVLTYEPEEREGTRPVPKPVTQPTVDCSDNQVRELAAAHPIAVAMVVKAMEVFRERRRRPEVRELLAKYFNDPAGNWRIYSGFKNILYGLKSSVKLECENKGTTLYDFFCPANAEKARVGYVFTLVGFRVHLCEAAFGRGDLSLADTLVHEYSHLFDTTNLKQEETYCWQGGCDALSRWDAYNNADSYSSFAADAYIKL
jgi:hypothetical protein